MPCCYKHTWRYACKNRYIAYKKQFLGKVGGCKNRLWFKLWGTYKQYLWKASATLNALARISPHIDEGKRRLIMNAFFISQFNYCPLAWMFHSRKLINKINRLHKRCLRITYSESSSTFEQLLTKGNSVSIHDRNLQVLNT